MKKASILVLLLSSILLLSSCSHHDELVSQKYFEVEIDPSYATDQTDNWIMVHDQNGVLLDAKHFESGDDLTFETTRQIPNNKIAVTQLGVSSDASQFLLQTLLCEDTRVKWTLKRSVKNVDKGNKIGSLTVTVTDPQNFILGSDPVSSLTSKSDGGEASSSTGGIFVFPALDVTTTIDDFFVFMYDQSDMPRYKFLENVVPGNLVYSINDLNSFDHVLKVNSPGHDYDSYFVVSGYENDTDLKNLQDYTVDISFGDFALKSYNTFNIGFLDRFKKYHVYINSYNFTTHYGLVYESTGNAPTSITMPTLSSFNATVTDKSFSNYSVSSVDYTWRSTSWGNTVNVNGLSGYINWEVIASPDYFKNPGEIPKVILDQYPVLKQSVSYGSSTFYKTDKPWSYILGKYSGTADLSEDYTQVSKTTPD